MAFSNRESVGCEADAVCGRSGSRHRRECHRFAAAPLGGSGAWEDRGFEIIVPILKYGGEPFGQAVTAMARLMVGYWGSVPRADALMGAHTENNKRGDLPWKPGEPAALEGGFVKLRKSRRVREAVFVDAVRRPEWSQFLGFGEQVAH